MGFHPKPAPKERSGKAVLRRAGPQGAETGEPDDSGTPYPGIVNLKPLTPVVVV